MTEIEIIKIVLDVTTVLIGIIEIHIHLKIRIRCFPKYLLLKFFRKLKNQLSMNFEN